MKIGEVSRQTGCNVETIRYYERIGIIAAPPRRGTYRDYAPADVRRLRFVRRARELGFCLEEVQALLDLAPRQNENCEKVQVIAEQHLASVRSKLSDLAKMELALSKLVERCGSSSTDHCPVVQSLAGSEERADLPGGF